MTCFAAFIAYFAAFAVLLRIWFFRLLFRARCDVSGFGIRYVINSVVLIR